MARAYILSTEEPLGERLVGGLESLGFQTAGFGEQDSFLDACGAALPELLVIDCAPTACDDLIEKLYESRQTERARILLVVDPLSIDQLRAVRRVDDIILRTYRLDELAIRVKLITGPDAPGEAAKITIDGMTIDQDSYEVRIDDRPVNLTYREYELLRFLASQPGRVFTRKTLVEHIWQYDYLSGTRTVDVHVRRLRSKLGPQYGSLVETVRHVGYRFSRVRS